MISIFGKALAALLLALSSSHLFAQRNLSVAPAAANEQRVALVIGNSTYKSDPLKNPANDAEDMSRALRTLGFKVTLRTNATQRQMKAAIREFGSELKRGGVGLFYFAGHGVQSKGRNYLVPIGAEIDNEYELEDQSVDANLVLGGMEEAGNRINIVVLDACRNNPFARSFRSPAKGLAQMEAAKGSFVAFATAPGSVAADGSGRNGVYTKHLLANLGQGDGSIEQVFKRTRAEVARETGNKQIPWESSSLIGDFYFRGGTGTASTGESTADAATIELAFWDSIKSSTDIDDFKAYIEQYPNGRFVSLARNRLRSQTQPITPTRIAAAVPSTQSFAPTAVAGDSQRLAAGTVFRDCADCPEMVVIPPGNYMMGGSRAISIPRTYAVGKFEVTFAQWDACVSAGGCTHNPSDQGWGRGSRPVMNVSWADAKQYTAWLTQKSRKSYRLLTDAEWEYAARAGTTTAYYWGDGYAEICQYASVDKGGNGCGTNKTSPVGERRPNAFGLHDMLGNVWEWTEDCWNASVDGVPTDGSARTTGECSVRVLRGGSWLDYPDSARSVFRYWSSVGFRYGNFGFRVARTD